MYNVCFLGLKMCVEPNGRGNSLWMIAS